jgi:hypothetical protein
MNAAAAPSKIKKAIIYLNLLSFCPPERVNDFSSCLEALKDELGESDWPKIVFQSANYILAFHENSREPDAERTAALASAALQAASTPQACSNFQKLMQATAEHPERAKAEKRLHHRKGCRFCEMPCRYGYFSLVSEPDFGLLRTTLEKENGKPAAEQQVLHTLWQFTIGHIARLLPGGMLPITNEHLGNLTYCLVSLATVKSRYAFPEAQMKKFQDLNQILIQISHPPDSSNTAKG